GHRVNGRFKCQVLSSNAALVRASLSLRQEQLSRVTSPGLTIMEVNKCTNCGLVNLEGDTRCQRCNDLLSEPGQTVSWTKVAPPPTHVWMADSTPPQPLAALTNPKLFPCPDC